MLFALREPLALPCETYALSVLNASFAPTERRPNAMASKLNDVVVEAFSL